jgi:hypothetical protein
MWRVLLCMCDSEATFHCVTKRPKMGTQKVIRIEEKVVCEFYFKVWRVHEDLSSTVEYRVAAIYPEHFQCFTVALKNHLFYLFFRAKPSQLFAEA